MSQKVYRLILHYGATVTKSLVFFDGSYTSLTCLLSVQMVTVYSPLTWGIYTEPPPDIPECGFVGELCPPPIRGQSAYSVDDIKFMLSYSVILVWTQVS